MNHTGSSHVFENLGEQYIGENSSLTYGLHHSLGFGYQIKDIFSLGLVKFGNYFIGLGHLENEAYQLMGFDDFLIYALMDRILTHFHQSRIDVFECEDFVSLITNSINRKGKKGKTCQKPKRK